MEVKKKEVLHIKCQCGSVAFDYNLYLYKEARESLHTKNAVGALPIQPLPTNAALHDPVGAAGSGNRDVVLLPLAAGYTKLGTVHPV